MSVGKARVIVEYDNGIQVQRLEIHEVAFPRHGDGIHFSVDHEWDFPATAARRCG